MTGAGGSRPDTRKISAVLSGSVFDVAEALLGCRLETCIGDTRTAVFIDEVEAYAGPDDPASHAFRGRTPRNESMFGLAGTVYVYRSYGIHWCMNVVVAEVGTPHAVLIRGGVPAAGVAEMERRRGRADHLADGPGKLCQALGVIGSHDGTSVIDGPIRLRPGKPPAEVSRTPRIGISVAKRRLWRYKAG